jgi:ubiquinone/menaquinone biosynthesis C-methylase UbiE
MSSQTEVEPSGQAYSLFFLKIYDLFVLLFCNKWVWKCPTGSILLPMYERHIASSEHHLDIGVGTGYFPTYASTKTSAKSITLMDINPNTVAVAEKRIKANGYKGQVNKLIHSVFEPFPEDSEMRGKFDSISMYYLLHCLPGQFPSKAEAVARSMAGGLKKDGVLFGCTVLARTNIEHNLIGRYLISTYNEKEIFGNAEDYGDGLKKGLEAVFEEVTVEIIGLVGVFICRKPKV